MPIPFRNMGTILFLIATLIYSISTVQTAKAQEGSSSKTEKAPAKWVTLFDLSLIHI